MTTPLQAVEDAARGLAIAEALHRSLILAAHEAGASNREIAKAAGVSHPTVAKILATREVPSERPSPS